MALFSLLFIDYSSSMAITGKFSRNGTDYVCRVSNQTYRLNDKVLKIYGKHLRVKVNGRESAYGNNDVTVFDASNMGNTLELVPTTIFHLFTKIREMRLEAINLVLLDKNSFKSCSNLKKVLFGKDNIRSIGASVFEPCVNLEVIEFNNNSIGTIDDDAFSGLKNLKVLTLNGNNLSYIKPELLNPLVALTTLTVTNNFIIKLHPDSFFGLRNLQLLNLQNNLINHLSNLLFRNKNSLRSVNLSNNSIATIERRLLENWPNHASLNLLSNQCINRTFGRIGSDALPMSDVVGAFKRCYQIDDDALKVLQLEKFKNATTSTTNNQTVVGVKTANESLSESSSDEEANLGNLTVVVGNLTRRVPISGSNKKTDSASFIKSERNPSKAHDQDTESEADDKAKRPFSKKANESSEYLNDSDDFDFGESDFDNKKQMLEDEEMEMENFGSSIEDGFNETQKVNVTGKIQHASTNFTKDHRGNNTKIHAPSNVTTKFTDVIRNVTNNISGFVGNVISKITSNTGKNATANTTANATVNATGSAPSNITSNIPSNFTHVKGSTFNKSSARINSTGRHHPTQSINDKFPNANATKLIPTNSTARPYLQPYEQADCRFYVNAKNEYTCVIKNARRMLKRINVKHLSGYTNENVTNVFFRNSSLLHVPRVVFDDFPHIKSLSLERCGIKSMDTDLFEVCGNLQFLDLSNNKINRVLGDSLKMCPMLEFVDLSNNPIDKMESNIFKCNPKLSLALGALKIISKP